MVPKTLEAWRSCIINDCKIDLTKDFAQMRLTVYEDRENKETQKFVSLYGEQHLQNIINWYKQV